MEIAVCNITAKATFHGHDLTNIPVLNPGDWFGKCWLLEIGGSHSPVYLIAEADGLDDAIDVLADDEKYGHNIVVSDDDLDDYDLNDCHFGPSGQVLDLDWLLIHGQDDSDCPFPCRYFGDGLPNEGMAPADFYCRDDDTWTPPSGAKEGETHVQHPHK
jgi:hypothetical protein